MSHYAYGYCGMPCALCTRCRTEGSSRCPGCSCDGYYTVPCKVHRCVREKGLDHCGQCGDFPCPKLGKMGDFRDLDTGRVKERTCRAVAAEGLPARLARSARTADSLEDFYARAKTKRYPHARLRRLALAAFLGLRAAERPPAAPYVRVLGLSGRGRELLRRMKETCALPVVVKPAQARALDGDARALFEAEARRTDLFGLCFPTARPCGLEWTRSPVVKERQG